MDAARQFNRSLILAGEPFLAGALNLDAIYVVLAGTGGLIGGTGRLYGTGKPFKLVER